MVVSWLKICMNSSQMSFFLVFRLQWILESITGDGFFQKCAKAEMTNIGLRLVQCCFCTCVCMHTEQCVEDCFETQYY